MTLRYGGLSKLTRHLSEPPILSSTILVRLKQKQKTKQTTPPPTPAPQKPQKTSLQKVMHLSSWTKPSHLPLAKEESLMANSS